VVHKGEKMDEAERYELVCKQQFDELKTDIREIRDLLKGKNGNAGVVDDVRGLKKFNKYICAAVIFFICTGLGQLIHWVFMKI